MKGSKSDKEIEAYCTRFPWQIRDMNIIPSYDKSGPKQVGYKWEKL